MKEFLLGNDDYIDIVRDILEYEENNKNPDNPWINDRDYDSCWSHKDVPAHPSKLFQLESNGILDRVADTNSTTLYSLQKRNEVRDVLNDIEDSTDSGGRLKLIHSFPETEDGLPDGLFSDIIGHEMAKFLVKRAMTTDEITNILFLGEKGSGKSVFLLAIDEMMDSSEYIVASEATSAGVVDYMFNVKPKYMLIDEFDDMDNNHQSAFASYTETGIIKEVKHNKTREMRTNIKTFAAANNRSEIKDNVLDRFEVLEFEKYTRQEFLDICLELLPRKEGVKTSEANTIGELIWDKRGYGDVRMAIRVARFSRGDPEKVINAIEQYTNNQGGCDFLD